MSYSARRCLDVSLNAVANLGYADCRFLKPVFPGDTLSAVSQVIGLKENSNRQSGVVHVRSKGFNQRGETVVDYVRWVMVRKRDPSAPAPETHVPKLPETVAVASLGAACPRIDRAAFDGDLSGSPYRFEDYCAGERIDHVDGVTVEEAEHQTATRLYQNAAKVHFNQFSEGQGRFGRRLIYGGHVISLARALSFNGLANAFHIAAINGGRHVAPLFAGDTVFAWSEVVETAALPRPRRRRRAETAHVATKNRPCADFPWREGDGYEPACRARARLLGACAAAGLTAMRLPADAVLLIIDAAGGRSIRAMALAKPKRRDEHRGPHRRVASRGAAAGPCPPSNRPTPPPLTRRPSRQGPTSSSSSAKTQAPSSAPTLKPGSTNSARRRWSFAGRSRPTRSKRRHGMPATSAIRSLSSPTRVRELTPAMSKAGSGQQRTWEPWRR